MEVTEEIEYEGLPPNAGLGVSVSAVLDTYESANHTPVLCIRQVSMMAGALVSFRFFS